MIRELESLAEDGLLGKSEATFLDLGTGNGHMLFALRYPEDEGDDDSDEGGGGDDDDEGGKFGKGEMGRSGSGWQGAMVGVDYSAASISLAQRISAQRHDRHGSSTTKSSPQAVPPIHFATWDLLAEPPSSTWRPKPTGTFTVILDKGTFDAISLMPHASQHPCATYRSNIVPLISEGGFLVLTSCNWTRDELVEWLVPNDGDEEDVLEVFREARYPSFTFGGRKGQSVVTLIFRRRG